MRVDSRIAEILKAAPGPSPWYPLNFGLSFETKWGRASWVSAGDSADASGKIVLRAGTEALLVLGMYHWVMSLGGRLVLWRQEYVPKGPTAPVVVSVLDCDLLDPITDLPATAAETPMKWGLSPCQGATLAVVELSTTLNTVQRQTFPAPLSGLSELLILAESSAIHSSLEACDVRHGLLIARPVKGEYEIVPQDWYNNGQWDFGYQWATRFARDPQSGRVVGDGIRMGVFQLDESNRDIELWIDKRV